MTTIVYRAGVMAGDSFTFNGDVIASRNSRKIHRLADGRIVGMCGERPLSFAYLRWLEGETTERPSLQSQHDHKRKSTLLVLRLDGRLELHVPDGIETIDDEFFAMGSGEIAALAALHMGADAVKAVQIAMLVDPFTGGEIVSERLSDSEPITADHDIEPAPSAEPDWRTRRGLTSRRAR